MISGRQTLGSIESAMQELRGKFSATEQDIEERNGRLLDIQQDAVRSYRELGRLRVEMLASDRLATIPDEADRTVQGLLDQRQQALQQIQDAIVSSGKISSDLERKRREKVSEVEEAAEIVDRAEKKTQDNLLDDPTYQQQLMVTRELERMAMHAQSKATQWEEELESKGQPYRGDPLFMYLWDRKFGTVEYDANSLVRWLDKKVARLIRYAEARVNFSKLQEIPLRLRNHADHIKEKAKEEFETLKKLDTLARIEDGIPALEKILDEKEAELRDVDDQLEKTAAEQRDLKQQQSAYLAGEDEYYQKAIDYLTAELRRDDLKELRLHAQATPFPEDDLIISHLFELEEQELELREAITELKKSAVQQQQRLREMESLLADFKRSRYDSPGTGFSDPTVIYTMLGNLINGLLTRESFWRILEQQRRYQQGHADPGFGSGGFGRGTVWGSSRPFPGKRSGSIFGSAPRGGFRFPRTRSGGRRGGGFSTGGGF